MKNFWQDLPVSKKLYGVVGIMAFLIAMELLTLFFAMTTLSAVRAFVGAEGVWSKAQKTAVFALEKYAQTRENRYYDLYLNQLKIPMGDHKARIELEKSVIDESLVVEGFLEGQNHPYDIKPMINLVRRFHNVPQLKRAIEKWKQGDVLVFEMIEVGSQLKRAVATAKPGDNAEINNLLDTIFRLDDQVTKIENEFSASLGEASRWLEGLLMTLLILAVVMVESTGLILTVSFAQSLTGSLNELNEAATLVGQGDFSKRVTVHSTDELGQLAASLNKMSKNLQRQIVERQSAEHASETKNLFLANMSHEIRTPLSAILGFSELLADPDLPKQDRENFHAIIKRTGASLTAIINDIIDVSKVEAAKLEIEMKAFSLSQLLDDLQAVLQLRSAEKGIQLRFKKIGEVSAIIESDPARLRQILANIVGNSIKFTEKGSVEVVYQVKNQSLVFTVTDTGAGISKQQIGNLFTPFSQGDDSARKKYGGTGLGLLISKKLAELLGGDVVLERSVPGLGTTFSISIAYNPKEQVPVNPIRTLSIDQEAAVLRGKKVLVVEDSPDNQLLTQLYLTRAGAELQFACDGREAIEKALNNVYDLILMDIQMPHMDGYTATRALRDQGYSRPIVALTGYAMREDAEKCLRAGCDGYLTKPFDRRTLVENVIRYSSIRGSLAEGPSLGQ